MRMMQVILIAGSASACAFVLGVYIGQQPKEPPRTFIERSVRDAQKIIERSDVLDSIVAKLLHRGADLIISDKRIDDLWEDPDGRWSRHAHPEYSLAFERSHVLAEHMLDAATADGLLASMHTAGLQSCEYTWEGNRTRFYVGADHLIHVSARCAYIQNYEPDPASTDVEFIAKPDPRGKWILVIEK